jgi:hypothetical protein
MRKTFTILFLFVCLNSFATTYYIRTDGNNLHSGVSNTTGGAWKNLSYACTHATVLGDIIHVTAGVYTETIQCYLSVGVSIEGDGNTSIINSTITGDETHQNYTIVLSSYAINTNGNQHIRNIKLNGGYVDENNRGAYAGIHVEKRGNVEIDHCTIQDFAARGIEVWNDNYGTPPASFAIGNKIHNCSIINCAEYYWNGAGSLPSALRDGNGAGHGLIEMTGQQTMLIYNNILTQDSRTDWHNGWCIRSISGWCKDIKIYNNTMSQQPYNGLTWYFAMEFWNMLGGIEIYNNTSTQGFDLCNPTVKDIYNYSVWVHDNTIGPSTLGPGDNGKGIFVEYAAEDLIVERNYFRNLWIGITNTVENGTTFKNIYYRYNVFDNIGQTSGTSNPDYGYGIYFPSSASSCTVDNVNIDNNTLIGHTGSGYVGHYGIMMPAVGTATNIRVRNNIIENFTTSGIYCASIGTMSNVWIQSNNLYTCGNSNLPLIDLSIGGTYIHSGGIQSNPSFISSSDFHLQTGSLAIGAGVVISGITTDIEGSLINSPPDIGAYKYGSTPPALLPVLTTTTITNITTSTAISGGSFSSSGGSAITAKGVCWSTSSNPTLIDPHTSDGTGTSYFVSSLSSLTPATTYYVRAYGTNGVGTGYGGNVQFKTANSAFPYLLNSGSYLISLPDGTLLIVYR